VVGERWTLEPTTDNQYICRVTNFGWRDAKATANWRDHGVSFHDAIKAFRDPLAIERIDDRENYGEERINLIGMCQGVILHVDLYGTRRPDLDHLGPTGNKT
jgi:uncharacterized DUF497 family protein